MIWLLLGFHLVVSCLLAAIGDRLGRGVFAVAAVPSAATTLWAISRLGDEGPAEASLDWVDGLDLGFSFSVGPLAALMTVIVSGIGVCVFAYSAGYFSAGGSGLGRFATTLLAFSTAMVGLVWADSVWTLFVFWEATSITSFLLVGFKDTDPVARLAARRALLITVAGGLSLLAGFVLIVDAAGTARLSAMGPIDGTGATVAAALVLTAAATKSAQFPFHVWLPGAMAAPTPVSAYLHSATMVKAGVVLVALGSPVLSEVGLWKPLGLAFGSASVIWGAIGALRHTDGKLILAWGTVSQLGLMITLLSVGTGKATFAAMSILTAHAAFKAALFMVVGEVDVRAGTRDIRQLSGLWTSMPLAFAVAVVSGASMAGVPPLLGFPAKEAAVEAVLGLSGSDAWIVGGTVIVGSILTVAYTLRLLLGLFGTVAGRAVVPVAPRRWPMSAPTALLGVVSGVGFVFLGVITGIVRPAAAQVNPESEVYDLLRWPGVTTAFIVSVLIVAAGSILGVILHRRRGPVPAATGAQIVDDLTDGVLVVARRVAGRVQHGSLPIYLATMAATAALATIPFVVAIETGSLYGWDSPMQAVLVAFVVGSALTAAAVGSRLGAALGLGLVGLGVTGLFLVQGAPDLVLTQLLVETVVVVGFVIGLGHLGRRFPAVGRRWRTVRLAIAGLVGSAVTVGLLATHADTAGRPPIEALVAGAVDPGGGNNTVNVILTDIRALDTLGEVLVLLVVAVGILALARPAPSTEPRVAGPVEVEEPA